MPELRDLIYLDVDKTSSLYSQLEKGLIREMQAETSHEKDERNLRVYDLKVFRPEFGGIATERKSQIETRVIHHDLIDRVEASLFEHGYAIDVNDVVAGLSRTPEVVRRSFAEYSCLRVTGLAVIEDYQRFAGISEQFNAVMEFIAQCGRNSIESSPEYQGLRNTLEDAKREAKKEKDRNRRNALLNQVKEQEKTIDLMLDGLVQPGGVAPWLIDGIRLFIDVFFRDRILLRLYPFDDVPDFGVLANLKREAFIDSSIENVMFSYGTRPNLRLTILGIVTSLPSSGEHPLEHIRQAQKALAGAEGAEEIAFEEGFRGALEGIEGMERFARFSRYPNVTVYPLAVFRSLPAGPVQRRVVG